MGTTDSPDLPVTAGAFQPMLKGSDDAFVSKLTYWAAPPVFTQGSLAGASDAFLTRISPETSCFPPPVGCI